MSQSQPSVATHKRIQHHRERPGSFSQIMRAANGVVLTLAVSFACGCGASRPFKYYQLSPSNGLSSATTAEPFPITLTLGHMRAPHLYREDRIVYSAKGEEMGTYEYQRWTEPPTEMIEETMLRALRASGRYQAVYPFGSDLRGDFLLRGQLFDFKEVSSEILVARVTLELELSDTKSGATVWNHNYSYDEPVNGKDISAVVAALDRNVQRCVAEVGTSLDQYFRSRSAK